MLELSDITLSTAYHTSRADFYRNGGKLGGGPRGATGAPVSRRTSHCIHTRRRITAPKSAPRTPAPEPQPIPAAGLHPRMSLPTSAKRRSHIPQR